MSVPRPYRAPLVILASLDETVVQRLIASVRALPAYAPVTEIERAVQETTSGEEASQIVGALLSLRGQLRGSTAEEVAESLSQSADLQLDTEARERLNSRAAALLCTDAFSTTAVAVDLQTQHQRNYQAARIFTDLRPVFQDDIVDSPSGAVIVETLQIQTWNREGGEESIFIAMDEEDLVQLQGAVDRALKKTETMHRYLDKIGLTYFRLGDNE